MKSSLDKMLKVYFWDQKIQIATNSIVLSSKSISGKRLNVFTIFLFVHDSLRSAIETFAHICSFIFFFIENCVKSTHDAMDTTNRCHQSQMCSPGMCFYNLRSLQSAQQMNWRNF